MAQMKILECIGFGVMLTKNDVDYVEDMLEWIYQNFLSFLMSSFPCDDIWLQQIGMGW